MMNGNIRRFGTVYPFVESKDPDLKMGRLVANFEFLASLLRYGRFDEYYFFSPDTIMKKLLMQRISFLNLPASTENKFKFLLHFDIKNIISKISFNVFHLGGFGYFMPGLAYLRHNYAAKSGWRKSRFHCRPGFF